MKLRARDAHFADGTHLVNISETWYGHSMPWYDAGVDRYIYCTKDSYSVLLTFSSRKV